MNILHNKLKAENILLKRLLKDGYFYINYDSTDCDGCSTSKVLKFLSLDEMYKEMDIAFEWADGSMSFCVPLEYKDGTLQLNEHYNGGHW